MADFIAGCAVLAVLGSCMVVAKKLENRLSPELSRKIIHITMGLAVLPFPWIFEYKFSVVILAAVALSALIVLRNLKPLKNSLGTALLGVQRKSFGEIYFVAAVVLVYLISDEKAIYLSSILVLTFADSTAALVGITYGKSMISKYGESPKTGEGSVIFFIVAFISTLIPLQLMTDVGRLEVLLISLIIGVLGALVEAVSRNGVDNLVLPFLVCSFLKYNIEQDANHLLLNLAYLAGLAIAAVILRKIIKISKLSFSYALLFCYIVIIQSNIIWLIPPILLYSTNFVLPAKLENEKVSIVFRVIESNVIPGLILIAVSPAITQLRDVCLLAYALSFSCLMVNHSYVRFRIFFKFSENKSISMAFLKAVVFAAAPSLLIGWAMLDGFYLYHIPAYLSCMLIMVAVIKLKYGYLFTKYDYSDINNYVPARLTALIIGAVCIFFIAANFGFQYFLQGVQVYGG